MTVRLKPEFETLIQDDLARGPYRSVDEFVDRAVRMLHEQEQWLAGNRDGIAALIEHGFAQAERGELIDGDDVEAVLSARRTVGQPHD
jgi:putative addiction module CopG family antidote